MNIGKEKYSYSVVKGFLKAKLNLELLRIHMLKDRKQAVIGWRRERPRPFRNFCPGLKHKLLCIRIQIKDDVHKAKEQSSRVKAALSGSSYYKQPIKGEQTVANHQWDTFPVNTTASQGKKNYHLFH